MESEPLKPEGPDAGPVPLGYAGPTLDGARRGRRVVALVGYLFVLASGLLLGGSALGLLGDRATGGSTWLGLPAVAALLLIGSLFTWAGALGLRYLYLRRAHHPLPQTTSPLTQAVRRLFHMRQGG